MQFELKFEEAPALVFVQEQGSRFPKIYQDGKEVNGILAIVIKAETGEITTHEIVYATGCTKGEQS